MTRPTNVTKHVELISCYFTTSPGGRADGRVGGLLEKSTVRLTQPSLAGTWAELGNNSELKYQISDNGELMILDINSVLRVQIKIQKKNTR